MQNYKCVAFQFLMLGLNQKTPKLFSLIKLRRMRQTDHNHWCSELSDKTQVFEVIKRFAFYPNSVLQKCRDLNIHEVGGFVIVNSLLCSHCSHILSVHREVLSAHLLLRKSSELSIT